MAEPTTLIEALQHTAATHGDERGIIFYATPESSQFRGFHELDVHARTIAAAIAAAGFEPGGRAVLALPPGLAWPDGLYGLLYAGLGVVPTPAVPAGIAGRIAGLAKASDAALLLTDRATYELLGDVAELGVPVLRIEDLLETGDADAWTTPAIDAASTALLMFTSGSTGDPKGVIGTHEGVLATARICGSALNAGPDATFAGWMPLHHAMGLLLEVIIPASTGTLSVVTPTEQFQKRPMFWLQMVSTHRATVTFAGNFAFGLCTQLATDEQVAELDLSSLEVLISGSEPVRPETVHAFLERFAPTGLVPSTVTPGFGMTEAMLIAMKPIDETFVMLRVDAGSLEAGSLVPSEGEGTVELASCGKAIEETTIAIVDPETLTPVTDGKVGELWISSPCVSPGYFRRPDATAETFGHHLPGDDRSYMRSGDLAGLLDGELFITGRLKEVIIIRGRNLYPQDIEAAAIAIVPGHTVAAAFELGQPRPGVGLLVEIDEEARAEDGRDIEEIVHQIRDTVIARFSLPHVSIALIPAGTLPRTPTGKVRRKPARAQLEAGEFDILHSVGFATAPVRT